MKPSYFLDIDPELKKMLMASLAFHITLVLLFTIQNVMFPSKSIEYQSAMKIDLIGLPQKKIVEPAPTKKTEEKTVPIQSTEKKPSEKTVNSKKTRDSFKKLKRLEALESLKKLETEKTSDTSDQPIKGNQIIPGTSLKGLSRIEFDGYIEQLDSHIKKNWFLPEWLARGDFKARINVKIDKSGFVIEKSFRMTSGNEEFDRRVLATVDAASPFPVPPEKFQALLSIEGVTFGFPE